MKALVGFDPLIMGAHGSNCLTAKQILLRFFRDIKKKNPRTVVEVGGFILLYRYEAQVS